MLRNEKTNLSKWKSLSFEDLEKKYFGVNHAELGAEIARRWRLADPIIAAINYNMIQNGQRHSHIASAVHIADAAMMMMGLGSELMAYSTNLMNMPLTYAI
jgi:HD-like signal output (HDOD) protein